MRLVLVLGWYWSVLVSNWRPRERRRRLHPPAAAARDGNHPCTALFCLVSCRSLWGLVPLCVSAPLVRLFWAGCTAKTGPSASRPRPCCHGGVKHQNIEAPISGQNSRGPIRRAWGRPCARPLGGERGRPEQTLAAHHSLRAAPTSRIFGPPVPEVWRLGARAGAPGAHAERYPQRRAFGGVPWSRSGALPALRLRRHPPRVPQRPLLRLLPRGRGHRGRPAVVGPEASRSSPRSWARGGGGAALGAHLWGAGAGTSTPGLGTLYGVGRSSAGGFERTGRKSEVGYV